MIFVVEDNDALRQALCEVLERDGHLCLGLTCAEEVDDAVMQELPDLYLVDLNLPGEDGLSLALRVRSCKPEVGIVVLTARTEIADRLQGYAQGIDLYLSKPIHPSELSAIVASIAKRLKAQTKVTNMDLRVQIAELILSGPNGITHLTHSELRLIEALARAPGQTLESWQVAAHLGQSENLPSKASVEVRLSRIRKKLIQVGSPASSIKAIKGYGYKLNVPITLTQR